MKIVIAVVVLVAVVQAMPPHQGPPGPPNEECIRESGISRDEIQTFDFDKLDASKQLRCYRRCVDIKDGRLLDNNMPNINSPHKVQNAPKGADLNKVRKASRECHSETASTTDPCDNWLAMLKCMGKKFGH